VDEEDDDDKEEEEEEEEAGDVEVGPTEDPRPWAACENDAAALILAPSFWSGDRGGSQEPTVASWAGAAAARGRAAAAAGARFVFSCMGGIAVF